MSEGGQEGEDEVKWSEGNEKIFLHILHERVKKDPKGAPTFKNSDWNGIDEEMFLASGQRFGRKKLKGKYHRLRQKHRHFSELLEHTGVTYIPSLNAVNAPEDVWQMFFVVIAFSDEEGVRFQSTFLGSAALAGILPVSALQISDKSGVTLQDSLNKNSIKITEEKLLQLKYNRESVWGYVEVHIEQGPVLEWLGFPLGVVKGIAGQTRLKVTIRGSQGHAGTVPMSLRKDPMTAAAELIVLLESLCKNPKDFLSYGDQCLDSTLETLSSSLVCTVGEISTWPSASNVIPGQVTFTVDLRAMDDMRREAVLYELSNRFYQTCERRSVSCNVERKHDANSVSSNSELSSQLKLAANVALKRMTNETQDEAPTLMSGAGHDAMAMSHLTKVGMIFVRCRGGVSHSPEEHVLENDVWAAGLALVAFLETHVNK